MARVFLSYSTEDLGLAESVFGWLSGDGHEVFFDRSGIPVGDDWKQRLYRELNRVDAVVCLVSSTYLDSTWCTAEVAVADSRGCVVIPLLTEDGLTHRLIDRQQYTSVEPERARAQVLARLRRLDAGGRLDWRDGDNPYPGLAPFTSELSKLFFGRGREIRDLSARVRANTGRNVIAVAGPSGCGKSSLLRAGLLPVMVADPGWLVVDPWSPGNEPRYALAKAIAATAHRHGLDWSVTGVVDRLTGVRGLRELADELLVARPAVSGGRVLVAIDQVEELFGPEVAAEDRSELAALLENAVAGPVRVVVTVRSEYLDDLRELPALRAEEIEPYLLGPLAKDMLRLAIEEPARIAGLRLRRELSARLITDTDSGDALPLLAFALNRLADGLRRGDPLTLDAYDRLGGLHAMLAGHAEEALSVARDRSGLPDDRILAGLVRLVNVDAAGRWARRSVDPVNLTDPMRLAIAAFVDHRLLTADGQNGLVRFAHEAMLTAWQPLANAIEQQGKALRAARLAEQAAVQWVDADRAEGYLWGEKRYTATTVDLAGSSTQDTYAVELDHTAREFLDAVKVRIDRTRRRERFRRARTVLILSVLLVIAVTAGVIAAVQAGTAQNERDAATVRGLNARADAVRGADSKLALRLGLAAHALRPSSDTDSNIMHTLTMNNYAATIADSSYFTVAFSPNRRMLFTAGAADHPPALWDIADPLRPRQLGRFPAEEARQVWMAAFSPTSPILVTGYPLTIWDVSDPTQPRNRATLDPPPGPDETEPPALFGTGVAFSPDGRLVASTDAWGVTLWNVVRPDEPRMVGNWVLEHGVYGDVAFSSDGRTLAATSSDDSNGSLLLWDVSASESPVMTSSSPLTDVPATAVAYQPDRDIVAVAHGAEGERGSVDLWDVSYRWKPTSLGVRLTGHTGRVLDVAFSRDGRTMATAGEDNRVILWDTTDPRRPEQLGGPLTDHSGAVHAVAFHPDGDMATAGVDGRVVLWGARHPAQPVALPLPRLNHGSAVTALEFGPDGRTLATSAADGDARLWDITNPAEPRGPAPLSDDRGPVSTIAIRPAGALLATGTARDPGHDAADKSETVRLWDISNPAAPRRWGDPLDGNDSPVVSLHFSTDGHTLWSANRNVTLLRWDLTDPARPVRTAEAMRERSDRQNTVAFRPDGRAIASGSGTLSFEGIVIRDITDPDKVKLLENRLNDHVAQTVVFSGDSTLLVTGGVDVLLWDVSTAWQPRRYGSPLGAGNGVQAMDLTPDGQILVAGDVGGALTLWNVTDRRQPYRIGPPATDHQAGITALAISTDGRLLASGDSAGKVLLWQLPQLRDIRDHLIDHACARAGRGFTNDEWIRHVGPDVPFQQTCQPTT